MSRCDRCERPTLLLYPVPSSLTSGKVERRLCLDCAQEVGVLPR